MANVTKSITLLAAVILINCGNPVKPEIEADLFNWIEISNFNDSWIADVDVTPSDDIIVALTEVLFISKDEGKTFIKLNPPDSTRIKRVRFFDKFYLMGFDQSIDLETHQPFGNSLFISEDGLTWDRIISGFDMFDVGVVGSKIHIGRYSGITSYNPETKDTASHSLFSSNLSDRVREVLALEDGKVFLACHDGVYATHNNGESWFRMSKRIGKDHDDIGSMVYHNERIYAFESEHIYVSNKAMDDFESIIYLNRYYYFQRAKKIRFYQDNTLIMGYDNALLMHDLAKETTTDITPEIFDNSFFGIDRVHILKSGAIIVSDYSYLFIGVPVNGSR